MKTFGRSLAITAAFGLAGLAFAQAEDSTGYGDDYQSGQYGRLRFAEGGATLHRADGQTDQGDRAGANAPVFPGDSLSTDGGQRAEVQLADGSIVRADRGTQVVFQSLPDPYAKYQDNTVLVLDRGAVRIASRLNAKDEFRVDTPEASIYLLGDGDFRIDTDGRGGTHVASLRGVAEVVGNESSVLVRGGTQTTVVGGGAPGTPQAYSAFASDGFDRWCASRDEAYRSHDAVASSDTGSSGDVPSEVRPYYGELSSYGSWENVPDYGTVWSPSGVSAGWRPYADGYWSYGPSGYFWVSSEPWGWAPYHYGCWQWVGGHGWCWIPGSVFAGAWVSWSWGGLYVGWAPLNYWGQPCWHSGAYAYGYYDPGCWTFVGYHDLASTHVQRYAVPAGHIGGDELRHATVVARPPRVDPRRLANTPSVRDEARRLVAEDHSSAMRPIDVRSHPDHTLIDTQNQIMKRAYRPSNPARDAAIGVRANGAGGNTAAGGPGASRARPVPSREPGSERAVPAPGNGTESSVARPRRILDDPRASSWRDLRAAPGNDRRGEAQDGVRDLYQRMSRPRETHPRPSGAQDGGDAQRSRRDGTLTIPDGRWPRDQHAAPAPRRVEPRQSDPRRAEPQRVEPQRAAPAPRYEPPRAAPAPRYEPPRQQAPPRSQPQPQRSAPAPAPRPQAQPQGHGQGHEPPKHGGHG